MAALTALQHDPGVPTRGVIALCDFGGTGTSITLADAANGLRADRPDGPPPRPVRRPDRPGAADPRHRRPVRGGLPRPVRYVGDRVAEPAAGPVPGAKERLSTTAVTSLGRRTAGTPHRGADHPQRTRRRDPPAARPSSSTSFRKRCSAAEFGPRTSSPWRRSAVGPASRSSRRRCRSTCGSRSSPRRSPSWPPRSAAACGRPRHGRGRRDVDGLGGPCRCAAAAATADGAGGRSRDAASSPSRPWRGRTPTTSPTWRRPTPTTTSPPGGGITDARPQVQFGHEPYEDRRRRRRRGTAARPLLIAGVVAVLAALAARSCS